MTSEQRDLHKLFKILSDKNRLGIILQLLDGEKCVCKLTENLKLEQTLVSHHLRTLKNNSLIRTRRVGKWTHCSVDKKKVTKLKAIFLTTFNDKKKAKDVSLVKRCS